MGTSKQFRSHIAKVGSKAVKMLKLVLTDHDKGRIAVVAATPREAEVLLDVFCEMAGKRVKYRSDEKTKVRLTDGREIIFANVREPERLDDVVLNRTFYDDAVEMEDRR